MKNQEAYRYHTLKLHIVGFFLVGMLLTVCSSFISGSLLPGEDEISLVLNKCENSMPEKGDCGEEECSESFTVPFTGGQNGLSCYNTVQFNYITDMDISLSGIAMDILIPPPKINFSIA